jgi:hypothetical protein
MVIFVIYVPNILHGFFSNSFTVAEGKMLLFMHGKNICQIANRRTFYSLCQTEIKVYCLKTFNYKIIGT